MSASLAVFIEFFIVFCCFCVALIIYRIPFTWNLLWVFPVIIHIYFLALGPGLLIATLNIKYRDFKHLVPLILRLGFYLCPIAYSLELVFNQQRFADWVVDMYFFLNPMVGPIMAFRWAVFGDMLYMPALLASIGVTTVFFALGVSIFLRNEASLVDNI